MTARTQKTKAKKMKRWKPGDRETYFIPDILLIHKKYITATWSKDSVDKFNYTHNLVCKTSREAIAITRKLLKVLKEGI